MDYVGEFETLDRDFAEVCSRVELKAELHKINKSRSFDYRDHYSDADKKIVDTMFEEDIETFKYSF
ncbi:hypothetical protein ACFE33_05070 [Falsihalocynthiibacter sp. SS001]|uniref:hypothetical protein n=1 Tax=Falsihalocynthiibacter sp. SS001 TaxID=3349698 RepID=UPI0036D3483C